MSQHTSASNGATIATEDGFDKVTKVAAIIPVLAAIYLTYRGLQSLDMGQELVLVGTSVMAALSWLLSQGVSRYLRIRTAPFMAGVVLALSIGFGGAEAAFAHVGIAFMLEQGSLHVHDGVIWFFSILLTVTNFFAKWAFLGKPAEKVEAPKPERQPAPQRSTAEIAELDEKIINFAKRVAAEV